MPVKRSGNIQIALKKITPDIEAALRPVVYAVADMVATDAALSITAGAVSGKAHVPSAPGEPPNADTHVLDRSIHVESRGPLRALIVADAPYAAIHELGGKAGAVTLPERPFMRPAGIKNRENGKKLMKAAVANVLKNGKV